MNTGSFPLSNSQSCSFFLCFLPSVLPFCPQGKPQSVSQEKENPNLAPFFLLLLGCLIFISMDYFCSSSLGRWRTSPILNPFSLFLCCLPSFALPVSIRKPQSVPPRNFATFFVFLFYNFARKYPSRPVFFTTSPSTCLPRRLQSLLRIWILIRLQSLIPTPIHPVMCDV